MLHINMNIVLCLYVAVLVILHNILYFVIRYQIMLSCWQLKNNDRPTFSILVEQLEQHYSDTFDPYLQLIS